MPFFLFPEYVLVPIKNNIFMVPIKNSRINASLRSLPKLFDFFWSLPERGDYDCSGGPVCQNRKKKTKKSTNGRISQKKKRRDTPPLFLIRKGWLFADGVFTIYFFSARRREFCRSREFWNQGGGTQFRIVPFREYKQPNACLPTELHSNKVPTELYWIDGVPDRRIAKRLH